MFLCEVRSLCPVQNDEDNVVGDPAEKFSLVSLQ